MLKRKFLKKFSILLTLLFVVSQPVSTLAQPNSSNTKVIVESTPKTKYFTEIDGKRVEPNSEDSSISSTSKNSNETNRTTETSTIPNGPTNYKKGENKTKDNLASISDKNSDSAISNKTSPFKNNENKKYKSDELIIKYSPTANLYSKSTVLKNNSMKIAKSSPKLKLDLVSTAKDADLDTLIKKLELDPNIESVEKNYLYTTSDISNDPLSTNLWGLENVGQAINNDPGITDVDIDASDAWKITTGNSDVVVGIIDTGIDINHPDIKNNIWVNTGEIANNGIDDDGNGYIDDVNGWDFYNCDNTVYDAQDGDEHGTHVAGTIAASLNNSTGIAGVAPSVKVMPLKFLGPDGGFTFDAILALDYARSMGVKITNNSWGGGGYSLQLENSIKDFGGLFVAAAGNNGMNTDNYYNYPSGYDLDNILSVAAVDNDGELAYFSNYGIETVDVAAPGVNILSTVPKEPDLPAIIGSTYNSSSSVFQAFSNSIISSDDEKKALLSKILSYMSVDKTDSILIVKNDMYDYYDTDVSSSYDTLIEDLGYSNITFYDTYESGSPSSSLLNEYSAVVWYTGESGWSFDYSSQYELCDYIENGGKLYLSGQYIAGDLQDSSLLNYYMSTRFLNFDDTRSTATSFNGVESTTFDGLKINFEPGSFVCYVDSISEDEVPSTALVKFSINTDYTSSYEYYNGTSMATPHVTGIAALLYSKNISDISSIKSCIMSSITPLDNLNGLIDHAGIVNAATALTVDPDDDIPGIQLNATQTGELDSSTDIDDVYFVELKAGESITINLSGAASTDFDLHLYDTTAKTVKGAEGILVSSEKAGSSESITYTATNSGRYFVDVYAYAGVGGYSLSYSNGSKSDTLTLEDNSKALTFNGNWSILSNSSNYSGGTAKQLNSSGSVVYTGVFENFKWTGFKGPNQGIARVYVDNKLQATVDLYSATTTYKQILFSSDFDYGQHTVSIVWTGLTNPAVKKGSANINIDNISITTNKTKPYSPTNLQASDEWLDEVDLRFEYLKEDSIENFNIYRSEDGTNFTLLDTIPYYYGSTYFWYTDYTVDKPNTTYYYKVTSVDFSGIESAPSNISSAKPIISNSRYTLDNTSPYVNYTGEWTNETGDYYDNSSRQVTIEAGAKVTIPYKGYYFVLNSYAGPDMGVAKITYPDGYSTTWDLYNPNYSSSVGRGLYSSYRMTGNITLECVSGKITFDSVEIKDSTTEAPIDPTGLKGELNDNSAILSWDRNVVADVDGYNIYRSATSGSGYTKLNTDLVTDLTYTDTTPLSETGYYVVKAVNYAGFESNASNETSLTKTTTLPAGKYEENNTGIKYTGTWTKHVNTNHSGGNIVYSTTKGNSFEFEFEGTGFKLAQLSNASRGIANITIDGVSYTQDFYSATTKYQDVIFSKLDLTSGKHTVKVEVSGNKNTSSGNIALALDYIEIINSSTALSAGKYEENNAGIKFTGTWAKHTDTKHSGGNIVYSTTKGNYFEFEFEGTGFKLAQLSNASRGIANITIDGVSYTQDFYSATTKYQDVIFSKLDLTSGRHTVKVEVSGNKNTSSGNIALALDYIEIINSSTALSAGKYEENNAGIKFSGTWNKHTDTKHSGGNIVYSTTKGNYFEFEFEGTGFKLAQLSNTSRGIANITIDGVSYTQDFYSSTTKYQDVIFSKLDLTSGKHTVKVEVSGNKNTSSGNIALALDYIEILK